MSEVKVASEVLQEKNFKKYGSNFQLTALRLFVQDKTFCHQIRSILHAEYFDTKYLRDICSLAITHIDKYTNPPSFETLKGLVKSNVNENLLDAYLATLSNIESSELQDRNYVEQTVFDFCAIKHAKKKAEEAITQIEIGNLFGAQSLMYDGFKPIGGVAQIFDFKRDYKKIFDESMHIPIPTPLEPFNMVSQGGPGAGDLCIVVAPSNFGKCWAAGTKMIMFDMTTKKVEDIKVGDLLMGPDGTPRKVLTLGKGREMMYEIQQEMNDTYTVNASHILVLKKRKHKRIKTSKGWRVTGGSFYDKETVEITVKDYLAKSRDFKNTHFGVQASLDFEEQSVPIDPYFLGIWLGDGWAQKSSITIMDKEVIDYLYEYAESINHTLTTTAYENSKVLTYHVVKKEKQHRHNSQFWSLTRELKLNSLYNNKHIPLEYIRNSRRVRLQVLAGLLDTDGHLDSQSCGFEICQKNQKLASDIAFLARSLGFRVSIKDKKTNFNTIVKNVYITGNLSEIPTKIKRKQANHNRKKNSLVHGINVVEKGIGDYFGFTLDKDGLLLLEDFTVNHNTNFCVAWARHVAMLGKNVAYFSLETKEIQLVQKISAGLIKISQKDLREHPKALEAKIHEVIGNIQLIQYKATQATVARIRGGVEEMKANGFFPEIIFVDGLNQLKIPDRPNWDNNAKFEYLCEELRDYGGEVKCPIVVPFQSNRLGFNTEINDHQHIGKAIESLQVADWLVIFSQTIEEQEAGQAKARLLKNRLGPNGLTLLLNYNPDYATFDFVKEEKLSLLYNKEKFKNAEQAVTSASEWIAKRKLEKSNKEEKK